MQTRLGKLDKGEYDAIILAAAGLQRLGLDGRIRVILSPIDSLPAAGQGALGIEIAAHRYDLPGSAQPAQPRRYQRLRERRTRLGACA